VPEPQAEVSVSPPSLGASVAGAPVSLDDESPSSPPQAAITSDAPARRASTLLVFFVMVDLLVDVWREFLGHEATG
jgi:hypothetical protein